MVGSSTVLAPACSSSVHSREAWERERVTNTRFPNRVRLSNQASSSLRLTTSPMTVITGGVSPAFRPFSRMFSILPVTVCCSLQVPHWTRAAGVVAGSPSFCRVARIFSKDAQPMSTTRVPPFLARTSQGMTDSGLEGSSLPLTTVKVVAKPRWVRGIPA